MHFYRDNRQLSVCPYMNSNESAVFRVASIELKGAQRGVYMYVFVRETL